MRVIDSYLRYKKYRLKRKDLSRDYQRWLNAQPKSYVKAGAKGFMMIIKPLGLLQENRILSLLKKKNVKVLDTFYITDYRSLAFQLFPGAMVDEQLIWINILENELPRDLSNCAKVLQIEKMPAENFKRLKQPLRKSTQINVYRVDFENYEYEMCVTPFHIPDLEFQEDEFSTCSSFFSHFMPIAMIGQQDRLAERIGNKARNLARLYSLHVSVCRGIVLPFDAIGMLLRESGLWDEFLALIEGAETGFTQITRLRNFLRSIELPNSFLEPALDYFRYLGINRFVVRSSSPVEDAANASHAGQFLSEIDVGFERLQEAIVNCFSSLTAGGKGILDSAVLIQEYIESDIAGVTFTADPNQIDRKCIKMEYHRGKCADVVRGVADVIAYQDKTGEKLPPLFDAEIWADFLRVVSVIQDNSSEPVDIEWGIRGREIFIFQARPITTGKRKNHPPFPSFICMDDKDVIDQFSFVSINLERHQRWYEKHFFLRKICRQNQIRIPWVGYFTFQPDQLSEELINRYIPDAPIIKVVTSQTVRTFGRKKLLRFLKDNIDGQSQLSVRIEQINKTDFCGYSRITDSGDIVIEIMAGGFGGFIRDQFPFSTYIVQNDDCIKYKNICQYEQIWKFDENESDFVRQACPTIRGEVSPEIIHEIVHCTRAIDRVIKKASVEWVVDDDKFYYHDASCESTSLCETDILHNIISPGIFTGKAVKLHDTQEFDRMSATVSVIAEAEFLKKQRSEEMEALVKKINPLNEDIVIVAHYPRPSLALLIPYVSGFIFEKGAFLSHLSIILREKGVPAVFWQNAMTDIPEDSLVSLADHRIFLRKGN
jgi:hypothetical protein